MTSLSWYRTLRRTAWVYRRSLYYGAALTVAQALAVVALPWPTKLAIDDVLASDGQPTWSDKIGFLPGADRPGVLLFVLAATTVVLAIVLAIIEVARRSWRRSLAARMANDLAHDTFSAVQRRSLGSRQSLRSGDLVHRIINDTRCIETMVFGVWFAVFQAVLTFTLLASVMLTVSWVLAAVTAAVAGPMLAVAVWFRPRLQEWALRHTESQAAVAATTEAMLASLPEIQAYNAEPIERQRFVDVSEQMFQVSVNGQRTTANFEMAIGAVTAIGTAGVVLLGGLAAVDGAITIGEVLVFIGYLAALYGPIEGLAYITASIAKARVGATRILALSSPDDHLPEADHPRRFPTKARRDRIEFVGVSFDYGRGAILEDVTLSVGRGEMIAVVGPTGSGKSTLVSLVPRFADPTQGVVRVDGRDVRDVALSDLRRRVAFVHQDAPVLPFSIRENVAYGSNEINDKRVRRALELARADEFVRNLPNGYETVLGEHGTGLSGGERQRIALARALYRNAPILILDEPTASLDPATEAEFLHLVRTVGSGLTIMVVSHRASTVAVADRVVAIEHGRLVPTDGRTLLTKRQEH